MDENRLPETGELDQKLTEGWKIYQRNIRAVDQLVYEITKGARGDVPVDQLLSMALKALDQCDFGESLL